MTRNKKKRLPQKNMLQPQGITHQRWFFPGAWREPFDSRTSQAMEFHQGRLELRHPALGEVWKWCTRYTPNPIVRPFPFNHAIDIPWMFGIHGCLESMDVSICFISAKFFPRLFEKKFPLEEIPVVGDGNPSFFTHPLNCWCYLPQAKSVVRVLTGIANQSTPEKPD